MSEKSYSPFISVIFIILCVLFCPILHAQDTLNISKLQIMEAPPTVKDLAGYMHVENLTGNILLLKSASSPIFDRIEFHYTNVTDGVAMMRRQNEVMIPARGSITFQPGGHHLMLINARRTVREGDRIPLTFTFSDGTRLEMIADVRRVGNTSHFH
jgi:copper(I)-binding protein